MGGIAGPGAAWALQRECSLVPDGAAGFRAITIDDRLSIEQVETFGLDYARALAHRHERFLEAWPDFEGGGGLDDRFRRMWELYLTMCEAGFRSGRIDVEQWVFMAP